MYLPYFEILINKEQNKNYKHASSIEECLISEIKFAKWELSNLTNKVCIGSSLGGKSFHYNQEFSDRLRLKYGSKFFSISFNNSSFIGVYYNNDCK